MLALGLLAGWGGCAGAGIDDPWRVIVDRAAPYADRRRAMAAAAEVAARHPAQGERRGWAALEQVLFEPGYPVWQRREALAMLERIDAGALRRALRLRVLDIESPEVLESVCGRVAERGWVSLAPALVASWSRRSRRWPDEDRPERRALGRLFPDRTTIDVVHGVFSGPEEEVRATERARAWELMARLLEPAALKRRLRAAEVESAMVRDLARGLEAFHVLPERREGLIWLATLFAGDHEPFRARAREAVASLPPEARRGLALRHLPVLAAHAPRDAWPSRAALVARIRARLDPGSFHLLEPGRTAGGWVPAQRFEDHLEALRWADLLVLDRMIEAIRSPPVARAFHAQAAMDRDDETSEHGGVLGWDASGGWRARAWPPMVRGNGRRYVPSPQMIEAMYTGLAHYHFHAHALDHARYAAPGGGDLALAERLDMNGLVLTSVGEGVLNADAYFAGRIAIDLGEVQDPG